MNDLLRDKIFEADLGARRARLTLPGAMSALMRDRVIYFPNLRPHQRHTWHAFLVQLGALALQAARRDDIPERASEWRELIARLAPGYPKGEPWRLISEDMSAPAFMQPPVSDMDDYKALERSPDAIDIPITAKNFFSKASVAESAAAEDWAYAIISLQTQQGFTGAGNYGVSRMNGGLGSRPCVGLTPSLRPGASMRRDMEALLSRPPAMAPTAENALLWTLPWNGAKDSAIDGIDGLHPLYIEICRRVRLIKDVDGKTRCVRAVSRAPRVNAKALKGDTGDPWTPMNIKDAKCLTINRDGFTSRRVLAWMTDPAWRLPTLAVPTEAELSSDAPLHLVMRGVARGQGKTEGYHESIVVIGPRARRALADKDGAEARDLKEIANERQATADKAIRIASHAIRTYISRGEPDARSAPAAKIARQTGRLPARVNRAALKDALEELEETDPARRREMRERWIVNELAPAAKDALLAARDDIPVSEAHRLKAISASSGLLIARLNREINPEGAEPSRIDGGEGFTPSPWARGASALARLLASYAIRDPRALARLKNVRPGADALARALSAGDIHASGGEDVEKWAVITRGIALMTPRNVAARQKRGGGQLPDAIDRRTAHQPGMSLGRAMFEAGDPAAARPFFSETRVSHLTSCAGEDLRDELDRVFAALARRRCRVNWSESAMLIGADGEDELAADRAKAKVARDYFRARRRAQAARAIAAS